jgi:hypothetical protein
MDSFAHQYATSTDAVVLVALLQLDELALIQEVACSEESAFVNCL